MRVNCGRMDNDLTNFRAWYSQTLEKMYPDRNAGIAVLMISMPLLERYLRSKVGCAPDQPLSDAWHDGLREIFPALANGVVAKKFWSVFRHGFLHQATLSLKTMGGTPLPPGELTHDIDEPILVQADGSFVLHPVLFSKRVIATIEANFATFVGAGTESPKLARVASAGSNTAAIDTSGAQHTALSTNSRY
jgi:hypothetical protein